MTGGKEGEKGEENGKDRAIGEKKVEKKGEEEAKKRGRRTNAEKLGRERSLSGGNILELKIYWRV